MRHNARLQHLAHANRCLLHSLAYHSMILFMHARSALSHLCLQHFNHECMCRWLCDEIAEPGVAGARRAKRGPLHACI